MSLRPRAPAPCAAATCCASPSCGGGRLAAVLATGLRLGPAPAAPAAPTGVVFTIEPYLEECSICFEPMAGAVSKDNPFIVLECQHAFHVRCISWHLQGKQSPKCPICIAFITQHDIDDIEDVAIVVETPDGTVYVGGRKVRTEFRDGSRKQFYEGERGAEYTVRLEFPDGRKEFYEGESGAERTVRIKLPDGETLFFEGERGAEAQVRSELPDGTTWFYEGEKGAEAVVRLDLPNGDTWFYEGEKGAEAVVRVELPDGTTWFYEGEKGAEHNVRVEPASSKRQRTQALAGRRGPTL